MEKNELVQNLIDKFGETEIVDSIIENHLKLTFSLMLFRKNNKDVDFVKYIESYNKVCEDIAKTQTSMDQLNYMFNMFEINKHYENITKDLEKSLSE